MLRQLFGILAFAPLVVAQNSIPDSGLTLELETVATVPDSNTGGSAPARITVVTQDPSGRVFASDQRGPVHRIDPGAGTSTEYLDLRDYPDLALTPLSNNEAGLQSVAFHPDFFREGEAGFGCLYTLNSCIVTATADFDTAGSAGFDELLVEWKTNTPSAATFSPAVPATPYRVVLRLNEPFTNHNGGLIAFNPTVTPGNADYGMLRISIGDGGGGGDPQNNAQNAGNPFGAILRIDPLGSNSTNGEYGIPADNVFAADGNAGTLAENYSIGLRNPQRFGWDVVTGDAYLADIGQDTFEEINLLVNGANYGWDLREGSGGAPTYADPVAGYFHSTTWPVPAPTVGNRAITCSDVFRGTCIAGFEGILLAADFPNGRVFRLNVDTDPLDGGIDGLSEVRFKNGPSGARSTFITLVNVARQARSPSLATVTRTDIRFSVNTPGRVFVSNKHDGIIRRIVADQQPEIDLGADGTLSFTGILQVSEDLVTWMDVIPQPEQDQVIETTAPRRFFRSVRK